MSETAKKNYLPRYRGYSRLTKAGGNNGHLSIPSDLMSILSEGLLFKPELVKDGILFRVVDESKMVSDEKTIPAWVKKVGTSGNNNDGSTVNIPEIVSASTVTEDDDPDTDATAEVAESDEPPTDDDAPF